MLHTHDGEESQADLRTPPGEGPPEQPSQARNSVLLIRLVTVTVMVGFVLALVYLGIDPYFASAAGIAITVAAVRMTRP